MLERLEQEDPEVAAELRELLLNDEPGMMVTRATTDSSALPLRPDGGSDFVLDVERGMTQDNEEYESSETTPWPCYETLDAIAKLRLAGWPRLRWWALDEKREISALPYAVIGEARKKHKVDGLSGIPPLNLWYAADLLGWKPHHPRLAIRGQPGISYWDSMLEMTVNDCNAYFLFEKAWKRWTKGGRKGPQPFTLDEVKAMLPEYCFDDSISTRIQRHTSKFARGASEELESLAKDTGVLAGEGVRALGKLVFPMLILFAVMVVIAKACG